jgi:hypothetical protein
VAMRALDPGGVLAVAGIHLSDIPSLNYEHELFYEKELRSVTSNTRDDGREFLAFALRHHVRATTHVYPMAQAQQALQDLKVGRFDGAAVLVNDRDASPMSHRLVATDACPHVGEVPCLWVCARSPTGSGIAECALRLDWYVRKRRWLSA